MRRHDQYGQRSGAAWGRPTMLGVSGDEVMVWFGEAPMALVAEGASLSHLEDVAELIEPRGRPQAARD